MRKDLVFFEDIKYLADRRAYKRISTVSGSMIAWLQGCCRCFLIQNKSTYRNTAAKSFGTGHDIRLYAVCLPCEIMSCTSHTTLDLVQDQDDIFLITELTQAFQELFGSRVNTSLALYSLGDDGTGLVCNLSFYALKVIEIRKFYATHQRLKRLSVVCSTRHGKCTDAAAVERMVHGNDLMICMAISLVGIFLGSFQSTLDSLCTTVCEECFFHMTCLYKFGTCINDRLIVIQVGNVHQFVDLGFQCFVIARVMIPQCIYSDTCCKIQIFLSFGIIEVATLAFFKNYRKTVICMKNTGF